MTALASTLKQAIDAWVEQQRCSPLIELARQGGLTPRAVALYLTSLQELFEQSQLNLKAAWHSAEAQGHAALAEYFRHKVSEEHGHERWAASDLQKMPGSAAQGLAPAPASQRLAQLQQQLLARHPMCFVVYVVWAEYLTVLLGDEWLDALAVCGYERSAVSAVSNHVEADRAHATAGFEVLDELWGGEPGLDQLLDGLRRAQRTFEEFCNEICQVAQLDTTTCTPLTAARG